MRIALAQLNPVVGDISGNLARVEQTLEQVRKESPDLVVLPELFLVGYPPRDLLEHKWFIDRAEKALNEVKAISCKYPETGILLGTVLRTGNKIGKGLYNAAMLIQNGQEVLRQPKTLLPTYDVFDEMRYFDPAPELKILEFKGEKIGVGVCEDAWNGPEMAGHGLYDTDPIAVMVRAGASLIINVSASPFSAGKEKLRYRLIRGHARRHRLPFVFVNQVGANDELVFDGRSMVLSPSGDPVLVMDSFCEQVSVVDTKASGKPDGYYPQAQLETVYQALVLGVRDYVRKCGFKKVVLGLSGGIDSAVACCIAVAALGKGNVLGVTMPSEYSSKGSVDDSWQLAQNLGIRFERLPISSIYQAYLGTLKKQFTGREMDVTEENIQARVRGNILMAISNKFGYLVLSAGNKSELAVGYCTLYGDMSGGLSVLADVPKTMVYNLARYINRERELIPQAIIEKPPSAELKPDQKDQDTLPPYDILDKILACYVEEGQSSDKIVRAGFDRETVNWVIRAVNRNEYKRRQAAPGLKVTSKAFGMGRRLPIAARYRTD